MSSSVLVPAAFYLTLILGPFQLACVIGYFLLRRHPAFAIRGPKVVLGVMFMKLISFFCISWLFLHPETPCMFASIMMWVDFSAHMISIMRKVVLLFRYEIQAALEQNKLESKTFDESNFFVRYRQILRPRTQVLMMFVCLAWVGIPLLTLALVYHDEAIHTCTVAPIAENKLVLSTIISSFVSFIPAMCVSFWTTRRLKSFPLDNWKLGVESSIFSALSTSYCVICCIGLSFIPNFDGILFLFFCFSIFIQFVTFITPLQLQRRMVQQLADLDLDKLASLRRLLQDADFLAGFDAFLRKEFSSENLSFWLDVNNLQKTYGALFPENGTEFASTTSLSESGGGELLQSTLRKAAEDCRSLGQQYIGDDAPRQINVSGFTGDDMAKVIKEVNELLAMPESEPVEEQLAVAVEEAFKTLAEAQKEVYESLRKDSYPRFLLSSTAKKLNQNEHFKRLLAAERLEGDLRKTNTDTNKESSKSSVSDQAPPQKLSNSRRSCEVPFPRLTLGAPTGLDVRRGSSFGSTGGAEKDSSHVETPELDIVVASPDASS